MSWSRGHCGPKMATTSRFGPQATPSIPRSTCRWACCRCQCGRRVLSLFRSFKWSPQTLTRGIWIRWPFQSQIDCRSRPPCPNSLKEVHAMTAASTGSTHQHPTAWGDHDHPSQHRVGKRSVGLEGKSRVTHPLTLYPAVSWGYRPIPLISYRCRPFRLAGSWVRQERLSIR